MNRGKQLDDILKNINTEDTWIDVQTVAALKNITQRAIRLAIRQDKYISKVETVRGGKCYKIKLSSLEPELQIRYIQEYYNNITTTDNIIELENLKSIQGLLNVRSDRKLNS